MASFLTSGKKKRDREREKVRKTGNQIQKVDKDREKQAPKKDKQPKRQRKKEAKLLTETISDQKVGLRSYNCMTGVQTVLIVHGSSDISAHVRRMYIVMYIDLFKAFD